MQKFLVLLGMPRCATSWLNSQISNLPGVAGLPRKEINYFNRCYGTVDRLTDGIRWKQFQAYVEDKKLPRRHEGQSLPGHGKGAGGVVEQSEGGALWAKGGAYRRAYDRLERGVTWYLDYVEGPVNEKWYRRLHKAAGPNDWCVDFSTSNGLVRDRGFAAMAEFAPETKAILILRHPLERLASHVRLLVEHTHAGKSAPLTDWNADQVCAFVEEQDLLLRSTYAPVVTGIMTHFAPENRLILNYETIGADPRGVVEEIAAFLHVSVRPKHLERLIPQEGFAPGVRRRDPRLDRYREACAKDLRQVQWMGLDLVEPWLTDLTS